MALRAFHFESKALDLYGFFLGKQNILPGKHLKIKVSVHFVFSFFFINIFVTYHVTFLCCPATSALFSQFAPAIISALQRSKH